MLLEHAVDGGTGDKVALCQLAETVAPLTVLQDVLDLRPWFTPERRIPVVTRRLASSALTQHHECEDNRRVPCHLLEELHEILYLHSC